MLTVLSLAFGSCSVLWAWLYFHSFSSLGFFRGCLLRHLLTGTRFFTSYHWLLDLSHFCSSARGNMCHALLENEENSQVSLKIADRLLPSIKVAVKAPEI